MDDDFEMISDTFVVQVIDEEEHTSNESPRDLNVTAPLSISENQPSGTVVGQFQAVDPEGGALHFFLMSTHSSYNNDLFVMESNGTLKSAVEFDYETASEFVIQVGVMDTSNATTSAIFNVSVIDLNDSMANQGPQDLVSLQILQVEENQPVGTLVGEFNASDPDGDSLFYFLTSGIGDDNNSLFTISGNQLRTNEIFDFESYHTLSIRVGVMDSEDITIDGNFTVIILDVENDTVNQAPENLHAVSDLIVSQDHILGSLVGEFNATDPEGGALSFFLTDATPNNDNSKFMITVDGELKVEELLSFDENQTLSIVVGVRDEYNASMEDTFTVFYVIDDTNDSLDPFYFESTNLAIYENAEIGSEVDLSMPPVVFQQEKVWGMLSP